MNNSLSADKISANIGGEGAKFPGRFYMTNNAKVGGVLSIVAGAFGVLGLLFCFLAAGAVMLARNGFDGRYYDTMTQEGVLIVIAVFYIVMGICSTLLGALAIVGGVFALRKKHWGWALAGAIASTLTFFPCGIPAIIFTAMGKPEFQANALPAVLPAPMEKIVG
jgi:hypothetical protein